MTDIVEKIAEVLYGGNLEDSHHPEYFRRKARQCAELMREVLAPDAGPFICGGASEKDASGLPSHIFVCPTLGLAGFAIYTKTQDYSEPGY